LIKNLNITLYFTTKRTRQMTGFGGWISSTSPQAGEEQGRL